MSFKSLKEFGVSAERLGSICKRWMARVQRFVVCAFMLKCMLYVFWYFQTFVSIQVVVDLIELLLCTFKLGCFRCNDCGFLQLGWVLVFSFCCTCPGKCLCARLCVMETGELQFFVHRLVLIISLPEAPLKGKWHDLVFPSSPLLFYYTVDQERGSICC